EALLWEPIRATLADPERLQAAALAHAERRQGPDPAQLRARITDRTHRLNEIGEERIRTFRDARQLGLTKPEIRRILDQLAEEHDTVSRELRTLQAELRFAETAGDPIAQARRLADTAAEALEHATLEDQAAIVDLLGLRVTPIDGGYEIDGAIPLAGVKTTSGKLLAKELQHP
ncbi:MAG TPA: hypothetical protein VMX37_04885, partial [Acidimicrobiia bacterium]|nr:hypothetical protein [Acidimicrobiia bacterium]